MKVIIIGGGIGGAVLALFLKRAGIEAEVYEARSEAEAYEGYFLNLAGNGIEVLRSLGLDRIIGAEGSPVPRMIMFNGKGKQLGEVRNGARNGLTQSLLIRRGVLQKSLHEAVRREGIRLCFGKGLQSIQGHTAIFEDGSQVAGDVLVGSDGIHSRLRQIMYPSAPKPTYTGFISTGGFTSLPRLEPTRDTQYFFFGNHAFFGYHVRSNGEIYWFNNHEQKTEPQRGSLSTIGHDEWKKRLLEMHRDDLPLIQEIIRNTNEGISGYPIYDILTQPLWHSGSIVLLGDAVHAVSPSSGQGASLAMEDAGILAKCLRDMPTLEAAFSEYENLRRARVERIVAFARRLGQYKAMANPIQIWLRDLMLPHFLKANANDTALDWLYSYPLDWENPIASPMPI
jgi:2-polyprenyl-6-methoxyphenol hydroxylase-like FAD-dependent oxidoreductase